MLEGHGVWDVEFGRLTRGAIFVRDDAVLPHPSFCSYAELFYRDGIIAGKAVGHAVVQSQHHVDLG